MSEKHILTASKAAKSQRIEIENDLRCEAIIWLDGRQGLFSLSTDNLDLSGAIDNVEAFCAALGDMDLEQVGGNIDQKTNKFDVAGAFTLPLLHRERRFRKIASELMQAFKLHLGRFVRKHTDAVLGTIWGSGELGHWQGQVQFGTNMVPIRLEQREGEKSIKPAVAEVRRIVENWPAWERRLNDALLEQLLPVYNEYGWKPEEAPPMAAAEFLDRLSLMSIDRGEYGTEINFDHDELFTDHFIELRIRKKGILVAIQG